MFILYKGVEEAGGFKIPTPLDSEEARLFLDAKCEELDIGCSSPRSIQRLLDKLVEHFVECQCKNPTFIYNHPVICSPLAKGHRDDPSITERFEVSCCSYSFISFEVYLFVFQYK